MTSRKATNKVYRDQNRTTNIPHEPMSLIVTKRANGGLRLKLVMHGTKDFPFKSHTQFFLDSDEASDLTSFLND